MQVEKAASTKVCSGGGNQRDKEFEGLVEDTGGTIDLLTERYVGKIKKSVIEAWRCTIREDGKINEQQHQ